jgi:hypothetical protein
MSASSRGENLLIIGTYPVQDFDRAPELNLERAEELEYANFRHS